MGGSRRVPHLRHGHAPRQRPRVRSTTLGPRRCLSPSTSSRARCAAGLCASTARRRSRSLPVSFASTRSRSSLGEGRLHLEGALDAQGKGLLKGKVEGRLADFAGIVAPGTGPEGPAVGSAASTGGRMSRSSSRDRPRGPASPRKGDLEEGVFRFGPPPSGQPPLPPVEHVNAKGSLDSGSLRLDHLEATFAGASLAASGEANASYLSAWWPARLGAPESRARAPSFRPCAPRGRRRAPAGPIPGRQREGLGPPGGPDRRPRGRRGSARGRARRDSARGRRPPDERHRAASARSGDAAGHGRRPGPEGRRVERAADGAALVRPGPDGPQARPLPRSGARCGAFRRRGPPVDAGLGSRHRKRGDGHVSPQGRGKAFGSPGRRRGSSARGSASSPPDPHGARRAHGHVALWALGLRDGGAARQPERRPGGRVRRASTARFGAGIRRGPPSPGPKRLPRMASRAPRRAAREPGPRASGRRAATGRIPPRPRRDVSNPRVLQPSGPRAREPLLRGNLRVPLRSLAARPQLEVERGPRARRRGRKAGRGHRPASRRLGGQARDRRPPHRRTRRAGVHERTHLRRRFRVPRLHPRSRFRALRAGPRQHPGVGLHGGGGRGRARDPHDDAVRLDTSPGGAGHHRAAHLGTDGGGGRNGDEVRRAQHGLGGHARQDRAAARSRQPQDREHSRSPEPRLRSHRDQLRSRPGLPADLLQAACFEPVRDFFAEPDQGRQLHLVRGLEAEASSGAAGRAAGRPHRRPGVPARSHDRGRQAGGDAVPKAATTAPERRDGERREPHGRPGGRPPFRLEDEGRPAVRLRALARGPGPAGGRRWPGRVTAKVGCSQVARRRSRRRQPRPREPRSRGRWRSCTTFVADPRPR